MHFSSCEMHPILPGVVLSYTVGSFFMSKKKAAAEKIDAAKIVSQILSEDVRTLSQARTEIEHITGSRPDCIATTSFP